MTRVSVDTSRLPEDVFTYTNKRFFTFIQNFCGKDEADLLSIQSIRSVDSFLFIEDAYSIFTLDSDDVKEIQERSNNLSNINTTAPLLVSNKDETEHLVLIENSIQEWCTQDKNIIKFSDSNFISGVHYYLEFSSSLDKVEIKCSRGLSYTLLLANSGNYKLSNYFRHLKSSYSIVQTKVMNNSISDTTGDNTQDLTSTSSSQQTSATSVRKRTRRATSKYTTTKKIRRT